MEKSLKLWAEKARKWLMPLALRQWHLYRLDFMVDLKGIEPSNLTDANRALSQLSYRPISAALVLYHILRRSQGEF